MTIWLALFFLIIIASFILAYLSMKDYQETPAKHSSFGIFLIQNPQNFTNVVIQSLYGDVLKLKSVITVERIFKGSKSALIATGPKQILTRYQEVLNLLELEDYTDVSEDSAVAWEVGLKENISRPITLEDIFKNIPQFETEEQFWWQLTLQALPIKSNSVVDFLSWLFLAKKNNTSVFQCQIRAVLLSANVARRDSLTETLESLGEDQLTKIPRPVTSGQIFHNYKMRSIIPADPYLIRLKPDEVLSLVGKSN